MKSMAILLLAGAAGTAQGRIILQAQVSSGHRATCLVSTFGSWVATWRPHKPISLTPHASAAGSSTH